MKGRKIIYLFLISCCFSVFAQESKDSLHLVLNLNFNGKPINTTDNFISSQKDTIQFETVKFYLSHFELIKENDVTYFEENSFHLIDFEKPETLQINFPKADQNKIKAIRFNLGIDSLSSVSGALKGDLDATNGMYWAWQSGFINLKLEGKSSSCTTRKNKFQFHIGGYIKPNYAMQTITLLVKENQYLKLNIDFGKLFSSLQLKEINQIMIPGKNAMQFANFSSNIFSLE